MIDWWSILNEYVFCDNILIFEKKFFSRFYQSLDYSFFDLIKYIWIIGLVPVKKIYFIQFLWKSKIDNLKYYILFIFYVLTL